MDDLVKRLRDWLLSRPAPNGRTFHPLHEEVLIAESERAIEQLTDRNKQLEAALREIDKSTISHVDGRDLLDELHPRNTLDIQRRIDGIDTWFEGDWLSNLRDARNAARAALGEKK